MSFLNLKMKRIAEIDPTAEATLSSGRYESLAIKRIETECFLLITADNVPRVLSKPGGTAITFRHAWQIRNWLRSRFNIDADTIAVDTY